MSGPKSRPSVLRQSPGYGARTFETTESGVWGNGSRKPRNWDAGVPVAGEVNPMMHFCFAMEIRGSQGWLGGGQISIVLDVDRRRRQPNETPRVHMIIARLCTGSSLHSTTSIPTTNGGDGSITTSKSSYHLMDRHTCPCYSMYVSPSPRSLPW